MKFPYFSSVKVKRSHSAKTLVEVAALIKDPDDEIQHLIDTIRIEEDKAEKKALKRTLPLIKFSSLSTNLDGSKKYSHYMCFDFDKLSEQQLKFAFVAAKLHPATALAFRSPSGDGLKVVIYDPRNHDSQAKFKAAYNEVGDSIALFLGALPYDATSNINWACFVSSDRDVYVNVDPQSINVGGRDRWAYNKIREFDANDYHQWYEAAAIFKGLLEEDGFQAWRCWSVTEDYNLPYSELKAKWNRVDSSIEQNDAVPEHQINFTYLLTFLKDAGLEFRWNADLNRPEVKATRDWGIIELESEFQPFRNEGPLYAHVAEYMQNNLLISATSGGTKIYKLPEQTFKHMYKASPQVQPMKEYAEELMASVDAFSQDDYNTFVMDSIGITLGVEQDNLNHFVLPEFFVAIAIKMLYPTALVDWFPVFVGPEGCGKTSMLDQLFPGYWRRYYNPSIELDAPKKDLMVSLEGRVLGHIPEMAGASRADIRRFKSFVSDVSFTDRLAYGEFASDIVSSWMLVGTANDDDSVIIPGDYNSRRVVVITVEPPAPGYGVALYMREIYQQLMGTALHIAKSREENPHSVLPKVFSTAQAERNLKYSSQRTVSEDLQEWFNNGGNVELPLNLRDLYTAIYPLESSTPSNWMLSNLKKAALAIGLQYHPNYVNSDGKRIRVIKEAE